MQFKTDDVVEGKITGITNFGVFADIGEGVSGMVHISEISKTYVNDIHDFLKIGDVVKMKVLSVGEDGKIALSIRKAMSDDPPKRERKPRVPAEPSKPDKTFVWEEEKPSPSSFEEMMNRFKQRSDEKISDLKRKNPEARRTKRGAGGR
ncbi:MAG: S1 RNA-binding domain-containing protein [Clostridia bacterium]|nr:S1 RNA-binding domain-containing protein [Clostridia bacterium]